MGVRIAEVFDQDGETWVKSGDPCDPPGWYALVRVIDLMMALPFGPVRLSCGAGLEVIEFRSRPQSSVWLRFPGDGRPPRLEAGMLLQVILAEDPNS